MHYLTVLFFLIAAIAALLGFTGMAGIYGQWSLGIFKGLFLISIVLFDGSLIADLFRWQTNDLS